MTTTTGIQLQVQRTVQRSVHFQDQGTSPTTAQVNAQTTPQHQLRSIDTQTTAQVNDPIRPIDNPTRAQRNDHSPSQQDIPEVVRIDIPAVPQTSMRDDQRRSQHQEQIRRIVNDSLYREQLRQLVEESVKNERKKLEEKMATYTCSGIFNTAVLTVFSLYFVRWVNS
tara:strand:- start:30 stop:533 length:504 start_codon:yes stop_codon:yes gene_type:complete